MGKPKSISSIVLLIAQIRRQGSPVQTLQTTEEYYELVHQPINSKTNAWNSLYLKSYFRH
ncbi:hypothetical protein SynRS9907_01301 [Synechococcus sp. RS9907]|nr:hypothetical protein SynRS9907_01301 [Synechococcus sp. RS9907]